MSFPLTAEAVVLPNDIRLLVLTVNPTVGAGVVAEIGTFGLRNNAGTAEAWQKSGAGDTAWTQWATGAHASSHVNGTDDIQDATSGQKGLATAAQITKLDGVETAADVTDADNVATAGAGMLATAQVWTKTQHATPQVLTSTTGHVAIVATERNTAYHDITEDSQIDNPSALAAGMQWSIVIEANGTNELTWGTYYKWGNDTGAAPDCSAQSDGDLLKVDFYAVTATLIMAAASEWYTP